MTFAARTTLALALFATCGATLPAQEPPTGAQPAEAQPAEAQPAEAQPTGVSRENLHVYLLIGQSNMAGRAPFTDAEAAAIPRCFLLNGEEEWVPAANPLNQYSSVRKQLGMQKMNPGYAFARTMLKDADEDVSLGLVVNAKGGSRIEEWARGTRFYTEAVRRARAARQTGTLKGVLWHQGEGNSGAPAGYAEKLTTLVENLRADLDAPDLPFVAGQIVGEEAINAEIARLPELVPHAAFASSEELTAFDRWHFDAPSMKRLGTRYAEAMLRVQQPPVDAASADAADGNAADGNADRER
ncbi:sialate O-acetylesterase [Alienimonas californiensis]|uniref:Carbohydrate acetyl esterase/feruloyl esterase n=1 Tax=Alienimonas californiensis TaxID=2527989 RepID=A0A517P678_9PLAN|nr:sialate O-acetylesterase [Alienimonas californiensis]QDT14889.1 Carbohydrate acetyl esterase/feruloyl esterase precursor [Alienimonas californiensis]